MSQIIPDCFYCLEKFDDKKKIPWFLSCCGNSICADCSLDITTGSLTSCPNCKTPVNPNTLKENKTLLEVISSQSQSEDPRKCEKHKAEITLYCEDCKSKLCHRCWGEHDKRHQPEDIERILEACKNTKTSWEELLTHLDLKVNEIKMTIEEGKKIKEKMINDIIDERIRELEIQKKLLLNDLKNCYQRLDLEKLFKIETVDLKTPVDLRVWASEVKTQLTKVEDLELIDVIEKLKVEKSETFRKKLTEWLMNFSLSNECRSKFDAIKIQSPPLENFTLIFDKKEDLNHFKYIQKYSAKANLTKIPLISSNNEKIEIDIADFNNVNPSDKRIFVWNYQSLFNQRAANFSINLQNELGLFYPQARNIQLLILNLTRDTPTSAVFQHELANIFKITSALHLLEIKFEVPGFIKFLSKLPQSFPMLRKLHSLITIFNEEGYTPDIVSNLLLNAEKYLVLSHFGIKYRLEDPIVLNSLGELISKMKDCKQIYIQNDRPTNYQNGNILNDLLLKPMTRLKTCREMILRLEYELTSDMAEVIADSVKRNNLIKFELSFNLPSLNINKKHIFYDLWIALNSSYDLQSLKIETFRKFDQAPLIDYHIQLLLNVLATKSNLKSLHLAFLNSKAIEKIDNGDDWTHMMKNPFKKLETLDYSFEGENEEKHLEYIMKFFRRACALKHTRIGPLTDSLSITENLFDVFIKHVPIENNAFVLKLKAKHGKYLEGNFLAFPQVEWEIPANDKETFLIRVKSLETQ